MKMQHELCFQQRTSHWQENMTDNWYLLNSQCQSEVLVSNQEKLIDLTAADWSWLISWHSDHFCHHEAGQRFTQQLILDQQSCWICVYPLRFIRSGWMMNTSAAGNKPFIVRRSRKTHPVTGSGRICCRYLNCRSFVCVWVWEREENHLRKVFTSGRRVRWSFLRPAARTRFRTENTSSLKPFITQGTEFK